MTNCHAPFCFGRWVSLLALLMTAAAPMAVNAATVYRWVDAQGRVHFGDPASAPQHAKPVPITPGTAVNQPASPPANAPMPLPATASLVCEQARAQYQAYLSADDIVETDSLGVERSLDDAAREQLIAGAEMSVARACDGAVDDQ